MEAAVADVDERLDFFVLVMSGEKRGGAAQDLALGQRHDLGYEDGVACGLERGPESVNCGVELNCAYKGKFSSCRVEVSFDCCNQMGDVYPDSNKDIERLDLRNINRDKTRMRIVDQQIAFQRSSGEVVDTARSVCNVTHDDGFDAGTEGFDDIGDGTCEQQETFGELEGYAAGGGAADGVDGFVEFEVVVGGEEGRDGFV